MPALPAQPVGGSGRRVPGYRVDMPTINVHCDPTAAGWTCAVGVDNDPGAPTSHVVTVATADLARLDPGATDPVGLVGRSFQFLLEREPAGSILAWFDLMVIARYFPEYERSIRG